VGDLCLAGIDEKSFHIDQSLRELFAGADLNVANLECALTHSESPAPHHPVHLKGRPGPSPILDLFHVFSLANNHIMDYGSAGLVETLDFLRSCNKRYFGAGLTKEEASEPLFVDVRGTTIAFIGFSRWYAATGRRPGTAPDSRHDLERLTARAKRAAPFVVVFPHWNYEYIHYPAPDNRLLARRLVKAGADVIVGSHPHVVQGYEQYQGKYIFHSLGNFLFNSAVFRPIDLHAYPEAPVLTESCILSLDLLEGGRYSFHVTPILTTDHGIFPLPPSDSDRFLAKLHRISNVLVDDTTHRKTFYRQAYHVTRKSSGTLTHVASRQGLRSMFVMLTGLRRQDLKILLHAFLRGAPMPSDRSR
jgi:hypothetical protein